MKSAELAIAAGLVVAGWVGLEQARLRFVEPHQESLKRLEAACVEDRARGDWARSLDRKRVAAEARVTGKEALATRMDSFMLPEPSERFWVLGLHDKLQKQFRRMTVTPEQLPPRPQSWSVPIAPEVRNEFAALRVEYRRFAGKDDLGLIEAPTEISVLRPEWSFRVSGPPEDFFPLLRTLQSGSLFLELTSMTLQYERDRETDEERLAASLVVSTIAFAEAAGAGAPEGTAVPGSHGQSAPPAVPGLSEPPGRPGASAAQGMLAPSPQ